MIPKANKIRRATPGGIPPSGYSSTADTEPRRPPSFDNSGLGSSNPSLPTSGPPRSGTLPSLPDLRKQNIKKITRLRVIAPAAEAVPDAELLRAARILEGIAEVMVSAIREGLI